MATDNHPSQPDQSPILEAIRNVVETSVGHATTDLRSAFIDLTDRCSGAAKASEFAIAESRNTAERMSRVEVVLTETVNERIQLFSDVRVMKDRLDEVCREVTTGNGGPSLSQRVDNLTTGQARIETQLAQSQEEHQEARLVKRSRRLIWGGIIAALITAIGGIVAAIVALV